MRLLARVALLFGLLFVCDRGGGALAEHWYRHTKDGDTGEQLNTLLEERPPVVVFGDSRAESHYEPKILQQALGRAVFNGGYKGSNSIYQFGLEQLVLDHYTPRLIVLDFSEYSIMKARGNPYLKMAPLHPFWRSPGVWRVIGEEGERAQLYFLSRLYPFNSKLHSIVIFNIVPGRAHADHGFEPQFGSISAAPIGPLDHSPVEFDPKLVAYQQRFLIAAHERGIPVILVISPRHATGSFRIPESIAWELRQYQIQVLDFSLDRYPQFA